MPAAYIQANTNGRLHPATEPSLSPLNRGFLYGDAIYEVWRTYEGVVFAWEEHWARLQRSAAALHLELPWTAVEFWPEIQRTAAAYRRETGDAGDLYIRLQFTRGSGVIGLDPALAEEPVYVLLVQSVPVLAAAVRQRGLRLSVGTGLRRNAVTTLNPAWKTGNYLNNILGLREARSRGADEVVMMNLAGELTEAAVSNIAWVKGRRVTTPPLQAGILEGITRHLLGTRIAAAAGVEWHERTVHPAELPAFDECFLMSTTKDVQPVGSIDGHNYLTGEQTVTLQLKAAFRAYVTDYNQAHPQLTV
jgi:branched-chain amino acid aminotransferase